MPFAKGEVYQVIVDKPKTVAPVFDGAVQTSSKGVRNVH